MGLTRTYSQRRTKPREMPVAFRVKQLHFSSGELRQLCLERVARPDITALRTTVASNCPCKLFIHSVLCSVVEVFRSRLGRHPSPILYTGDASWLVIDIKQITVLYEATTMTAEGSHQSNLLGDDCRKREQAIWT